LLVQEGLCQNWTEFIRAVRSQLDKHEPSLPSAVVCNDYSLGIFSWGRKDLEEAVANGERKSFNVFGMLVIADDVSPELTDQAIESIRKRGTFRASEVVKEMLKDRIR
jgi:hypothetical protein